jgi:cation transport ATPase
MTPTQQDAATTQQNAATTQQDAATDSNDHRAPVGEDEDSDAAARDLEREHEQLFHELRAIIPGAEVLFAFLLTVAFSERFDRLTDLQRNVYFSIFVGAGVALLLLLAPSSFHRVRFRQRDKDVMMRAANIESIAALVLISLSISGSVFLITDLLFDTTAAIAVAAALWCSVALLWWGFPLARRWMDRTTS